MAVDVEEDVLGLEVPVDDVKGVEVVESEGDLGGVEFGDGIRKALWEGRGGESSSEARERNRRV